jgi:hypothetical protein
VRRQLRGGMIRRVLDELVDQVRVEILGSEILPGRLGAHDDIEMLLLRDPAGALPIAPAMLGDLRDSRRFGDAVEAGENVICLRLSLHDFYRLEVVG